MNSLFYKPRKNRIKWHSECGINLVNSRITYPQIKIEMIMPNKAIVYKTPTAAVDSSKNVSFLFDITIFFQRYKFKIN